MKKRIIFVLVIVLIIYGLIGLIFPKNQAYSKEENGIVYSIKTRTYFGYITQISSVVKNESSQPIRINVHNLTNIQISNDSYSSVIPDEPTDAYAKFKMLKPGDQYSGESALKWLTKDHYDFLATFLVEVEGHDKTVEVLKDVQP